MTKHFQAVAKRSLLVRSVQQHMDFKIFFLLILQVSYRVRQREKGREGDLPSSGLLLSNAAMASTGPGGNQRMEDQIGRAHV